MTLADVPAAWRGPLRRFLTLALAAVFGSVLVNIAVGLSTAMRELGGVRRIRPAGRDESVPVSTALTGIDALDLPLAVLLGASLCLLAAVVRRRRSRRGNLIWPCSGAIAAGVVATAIVGMIGASTPSFRGPALAGMAAARHQLSGGSGPSRSAANSSCWSGSSSPPNRSGTVAGSSLRLCSWDRASTSPGWPSTFAGRSSRRTPSRAGATAAPAVGRHHRCRLVLARRVASVVETVAHRACGGTGACKLQCRHVDPGSELRAGHAGDPRRGGADVRSGLAGAPRLYPAGARLCAAGRPGAGVGRGGDPGAAGVARRSRGVRSTVLPVAASG